MLRTNDTIVAPATPLGVGAIGVIRLSGRDAITTVAKLFKGKNLNDQPSHTLHFGKIMDQGSIIDEVVVSIFRAPASYTGEDVAEISCHGSQYIISRVLELCVAYGVRLADPGEFTLRAYLHGKMDLAQAEAVADLIASQSSSAHKAAMHNLRGGFSNDLKALREELIKFSALIELELDFSQEDVEFADRKQLYNLIKQLTDVTNMLICSFQLGNVIKNGVKVAIIGKPNSGKSTLLNALLNEERAIVSNIAGTTRDTIEETLNINGILFRLIDTAGIREHTIDVIEAQGIARSREAMQQADVVIYLFDVTNQNHRYELLSFITDSELIGIKYLLVGNKVDEINDVQPDFRGFPTPILIAAKDKTGIEELKEGLYNIIADGVVDTESTIVTNARHYNVLQQMLNALIDVKTGMDNNLSSDLLSSDIRNCLHYLGEITGEITTEDKLDYIFSKFCIGK